MIKRTISNQKSMLIYGMLGAAFIVLSLLTNVTFPVVILSIILLCKVVPLPASVSYLTIRIVLAVVLQLTLYNIFGLLFYLLKVDINANIYSILSLISVGVLFAFRAKMGKVYVVGKFSRFDVVTMIPVLVGAGFLLLYIFGNSLSFSENLIRFMGSSSDQSAHLSMYNDILRNDGNHVYSSDKLSINTPGINSYPMGWHQAMAALSLGLFNINPANSPFIDVVTIYFICAFFTFLLCGIMISAFTGLIYNKIYKTKAKESKLFEILAKSFAVLVVTFLFSYVAFCEFGYTNFIYAVTIVLLCSVLATGLASSDIKIGTIFLFALLLFASVEAWYIIGLPLGIAFLSLVILYLKRDIRSALRPRSILILVLCGLLLGVALLAALYSVVKDGPSDQIMIGNGPAAWLPNTLVIISIVVSAIILSNGKREDLFHIVINSFFASVLLLTAWNFLSLQEYSYYQQKMLYALFVLCIPIAFIAAIKYLNNKNIQLPISLSVIIFAVYTINPVGITAITENIMRPKSDPEINIINNYFQSKFNDKSTTIFIKDYREDKERPTEAYARLLLSKVVSPDDCYNQLIMPLISLGDQNKSEQKRRNIDTDSTAAKCYGPTRFFILTDDKN